jgi:hypothetical protein
MILNEFTLFTSELNNILDVLNLIFKLQSNSEAKIVLFPNTQTIKINVLKLTFTFHVSESKWAPSLKVHLALNYIRLNK